MKDASFTLNINWRDTARPIRFFMLDARVLWILLLWAFHMCLETLVLALVGVAIFAWFEFWGLTPVAALKSLKNILITKERGIKRFYAERRRYQW